MPDSITLYQLNEQIKDTINLSFPETIWIIAEISELGVNQISGHCYLELVEKNKKNNSIKAKARATIWSFTYRMLKPYFETTTGKEFTSGLKVLVKVSVEFHELYSLSLNILDIDPSYTVGDLALQKQIVIKKLKEEGIFEMNKELILPLIPQKIAVISSKTAAGYEDFVNQIENNEFGYKLYSKLFPAIMQGKKAEDSIIQALDKIYNYEDFFDVVVLIRGGGSKIDLSCFDNYWLASHISQFPLPVLTGIGHERDDSVVDMVAHTKLKTPTAVAEFLITQLFNFNSTLTEYQTNIVEYATNQLLNEQQLLNSTLLLFQTSSTASVLKHQNKLDLHLQKIQSSSISTIARNSASLASNSQILKNSFLKYFYNEFHFLNKAKSSATYISKTVLTTEDNKLEIFQNTIEFVNPQKILNKGYSLSYIDGRLIKNINEVQENQEMKTILAKGKLISTINRKIKK